MQCISIRIVGSLPPIMVAYDIEYAYDDGCNSHYAEFLNILSHTCLFILK